ncbi:MULTISPECIES: PIN domain-containing protein [unclassified Kitasatospora]|uniref:PIN domain-containing protein n=1 Tax=unclassified Kitasatospora TaxID=2633591 RepID=UPI00382054D0
MIGGFLIDTSAYVRLVSDRDLRSQWWRHIESGLIRISKSTRTEILFSARNSADRDELEDELAALFGAAVSAPKSIWDWIDTTQYKLTQKGQHRAAGLADLLLAGTAVHHDMTVLHLDDDFATVARVVGELREQDIRRSAAD